MRPRFQWNLGRRSLALGERTLVMGILNVTPDSFSDGGRYLATEMAVEHGIALLNEGADILDIGGESTRPGTPTSSHAGAVSAQQELDRVLPVIEALRRERPDAILSIDTYKSSVAQAALEAGAEIVNDVSGLTWDPEMASMLAARRCGLILMHTRGTPDEWGELPPLPDPVALVRKELADRTIGAVEAGIQRDSIVLDPGFGFGKRLDENCPLLARFAEFHSLGFPLLAGVSRKRFLAHILADRVADLTDSASHLGLSKARGEGGATALAGVEYISLEQRDIATLSATVVAALAGAHIARVHAVRPAVEALAIADAILDTK